MTRDATPFTTREACDADLPAITAIYNEAVRNTFAIWSETEATLDQRRTWMDMRRSAGMPVRVAVDPAGEVVAYASYGPFREPSGYRLTVEHSLYVAPHAQRHGLGRQLLEELIGRARQAGLRRMVAGVDAANAASIRLHESAGFELQGMLKGVGVKHGRTLDLAFLVRALD